MWDVLTWHNGTLAIAWWAVIGSSSRCCRSAARQLRVENSHARGMRDAHTDRSAVVGGTSDDARARESASFL